jgi:hypothetical protein
MTTYLLRNIDTTTWEKFADKCGRIPMRVVLLRVIKAIATGKLTIDELPHA